MSGVRLIFLGIGSSITPQRRRPNPNSLREFLVHRFNRIDVLGVMCAMDARLLAVSPTRRDGTSVWAGLGVYAVERATSAGEGRAPHLV